jgi:hypothetical protein
MNRTVTAFKNAILAREVARRHITAASIKVDKPKVKQWMTRNVHEYVDHATDEVNCTALSEAAASEFNLYENDREFTIPSVVFDLAVDVAKPYEKSLKSKTAAGPLVVLDDEAFEALTPEQTKEWKGYFYKMTYDIVTEESAAEGDTAENGWEEEGSEAYDSLEDLLREVRSKAHWLEWSSSVPHPGAWITSEAEQDMHSGDYKNYDLFIERVDKKPLSREEFRFIHHELRLHGSI